MHDEKEGASDVDRVQSNLLPALAVFLHKVLQQLHQAGCSGSVRDLGEELLHLRQIDFALGPDKGPQQELFFVWEELQATFPEQYRGTMAWG